MPFDDKLANRVRKILEKIEGLSEKKMFGGLCFLINGNMAFGLVNDDLMIRVEPESYEKMLSQPHVRKMDFTGKPLKGFLYIGVKGTESDKDLRKWVLKGIEFAMSLPGQEKGINHTGSPLVNPGFFYKISEGSLKKNLNPLITIATP